MVWTYNTADGVANDGPQITAVAIALTSASLGTLLLRLYVRVWMIKAIGAGIYGDPQTSLHTQLTILLQHVDDWVLIFTWVSQEPESVAIQRLTMTTDSIMRICCCDHCS
jgi:hypothetical protein